LSTILAKKKRKTTNSFAQRCITCTSTMICIFILLSHPVASDFSYAAISIEMILESDIEAQLFYRIEVVTRITCLWHLEKLLFRRTDSIPIQHSVVPQKCFAAHRYRRRCRLWMPIGFVSAQLNLQLRDKFLRPFAQSSAPVGAIRRFLASPSILLGQTRRRAPGSDVCISLPSISTPM
jgi:hypothetical protein